MKWTMAAIPGRRGMGSRQWSLSSITRTLVVCLTVGMLPVSGSSGPVTTNYQFRPHTGAFTARLSKDRPTIYISFERVGKRKPVFIGESERGIWLRLHNNTRWPLILRVFGIVGGGELGVTYGVEFLESTTPNSGKQGPVREQQRGRDEFPQALDPHTYTVHSLAPGRSFLFSVPREHLAEALAIYVSFNYEWETKEGALVYDEPEHRVYFYSYDLPRKVRDE